MNWQLLIERIVIVALRIVIVALAMGLAFSWGRASR